MDTPHGYKLRDFTDASGRLWAVLLPEDAPDADAPKGFIVGPPDLSELDLPRSTMVRLHNELFHRRLLTAEDARLRRPEFVAALSSAFKVDAGRVADLYDVESR